MEIRVVLFVEDTVARQKYLDALAACNVRVFVAPSFFHLEEEICNQTYHGLLLDLPTKMKAIKESKAEVYRLTATFPVAHLQIDRRTGEIRCFHSGLHPGRTLRDFITHQCRTFDPQKIRISVKRDIHMPVLLYRRFPSKRPERAITRDVSTTGCFIISAHCWSKNSKIFLVFSELTDNAPIQAKICLVTKWGTGHEIPGIGVQFEHLSMSQADELAELCGPVGL